jgi:ATP-binding cassette subfamily C protein/ATP-binding cassette subfamily C protein LapB
MKRKNNDQLFSVSLNPIIDALGWRGSDTDLAEAMVYNSGEMDENGFIDTMANLKYESIKVKTSTLCTDNRFFPFLCITKDNNLFCVIKKETNGYFVFNSRNREYHQIEKIENLKYIYFFVPVTKFSDNLLRPQKNWFSKLLYRFKKEVSFAIILSFFIAAFSFITPLFIMLIYSQINTVDNFKILLYLGAATLIFILAQSGFKFLRRYLLSYLSSRIGYILNTEVMRRILYLQPKYTETASIEAQTARINDFENIKDFFSGSAFRTILDLPFTILMLAGLVIIGGPIAYIPFSALIIFAVSVVFTYKAVKKEMNIIATVKSEKNKLESEIFKNISHIQYIGNPEVWNKRYNEYSASASYESYRESRTVALINVFSQTLVNILLILTISISVNLVLNKQISSGTLFASFIITARILSPMKRGFTVFSQLSSFRKSVDQLNKFMNIPIESKPETVISMHKKIEGNISFNNVYLKYGSEYEPALSNISFTAKKGEIVTITGHHGSGKSSILKLILGLYSPGIGNIIIDNVRIKQLDPILLRKSISYMPKQFNYFDGTILDNLQYSKPSAKIDEINHALNLAGLKNLIDILPAKLDTNINDKTLLKNDKNFYFKFNLAMLLIRQSRINLIGKLSEINENLVESLEYLKKNSSILIISDNDQIQQMSDKILHLESGKLKFSGTYKAYKARYKESINET